MISGHVPIPATLAMTSYMEDCMFFLQEGWGAVSGSGK